jgi:two-component system LytT family sensor kinase
MFISLAWVVPAVLAAINPLAQRRLSGVDRGSVRDAIFWSLQWFLCALFTPGVFAIARRWPITRLAGGRRILLHVLLSVVFCVVWAAGGTLLKVLIEPDAISHGLAKFALSWFFGTLSFGSAVYFAMIGIEHAIRYFVEAREGELKLARLSEQLTGARLAALQARLNPHFLFNSLNTVAVLVRDGERATATRVIEQLSDLLRLIIGRTDENEVRLEEELKLVRLYLAVEEARFSDRLVPRMSIAPEAAAAAVPSFAVQHLVENALRHGIAKRTESGRVIITARRDVDMLEVTVTDDGVGIDAGAADRPRHGIANTRDRLRNLYGVHASLKITSSVNRGTVARLRLPFREMPPEREADVEE